MINRRAFSVIGLAIFILAVATFSRQPTHATFAQSPQAVVNVEPVLAANARARVIVTLHPPEDRSKVSLSVQQIARDQNSVLDKLSTKDFQVIHKYETLPGLAGEVTQEGLDALLNHPQVEAVALDLPVETVLTESIALINADDVFYSFGLTGLDIKVAVLDTGIDSAHPDLTGSVIAQHCFNRLGCPPGNTDESGNALDENSHGTHVAGIIASQGQTSPRGIAPDVGIVAVRVLGSGGSGFTSDVLAGIDWVVANQAALNVKVMNLSLGGGSYEGVCDQADANTLLYATAVETARQAGITLVAASGNSGQSKVMMAPACISGVISVGNVYDTDMSQMNWPTCLDENIVADQVACSSNSSSVLDLLAPGVLVDSTHLGGGQSSKSGTSMATAHVTAVAALMLQANPALAPPEIEAILKETGVPIVDNRNGRVTPRIDALAAVIRVMGSEVTSISGTVLLQGRVNHSGSSIFLSEELCSTAPVGVPAATTEADGGFELIVPAGRSYQCLQVVQPGYLIGQKSFPEGDLGIFTIPGGDVNGDNIVDIFDLAFIASRYGTSDPTADINADGMIDIFDLALSASNYELVGPVNIEPGS